MLGQLGQRLEGEASGGNYFPKIEQGFQTNNRENKKTSVETEVVTFINFNYDATNIQ
jgi:hypothetical protein